MRRLLDRKVEEFKEFCAYLVGSEDSYYKNRAEREKPKKALYARAQQAGRERKASDKVVLCNTGVNLEELTIVAREVC